MILSIAQPAYLPWLGYFDRIGRSDLHVVLDDVPIGHRSFVNRNRIRTASGWTWLSVPVHGRLPEGRTQRILDISIVDGDRWRHKHWDSIRFAYAHAPFFAEHSDYWLEIFSRPWQRLTDLLTATTEYLLSTLDIRTPLVRSSEIAVRGSKSDLILDLCLAVGADAYLSGPFGREYLDQDSFAAHG